MDPAIDDGEGRTFDLLRGIKTGALTAEQSAFLEHTKSDVAGKDAAILVVEDTKEVREVIRQLLHGLGYPNVFEAIDGQTALDIIRRQAFDLILLDVEMPRLNGYGVLAALKSDPLRRHLPVIVTSGLQELDAVVRCIELGAEDFLPKPVNLVLLRARITSSLERKRLRDLERLRLIEAQLEKELLEFEKEKSERLLLNILPLAIAERLKQGDHTIAERYANVTILFADLIGFTDFANNTDPESLVSLLNDLFSRFDRIAGRHGLEKIKTIGDSYLVVGGLPKERPDHAEAVAEMALEMLTALAELNREHSTSFGLRIGFNSGTVVAGVIGRKKFTYDLWGTAVNLASRMQSTCPPNCIQLSSDTAELLHGKFRLFERGDIECKGLGKIHTYLLGEKLAKGAGAPAGEDPATGAGQLSMGLR
jgi:class 3 adenylate cyclase/CheY-like chemotaxis protein